MEKTLGEQRVRTSFNISGDSFVDGIKQDTAKLIDKLEQLKTNSNLNITPEFIRLISLAQTTYEEAAMWAVKAATI